MSAGRRLPLAVAEKVAGAILERLAPACERIEVVGSVRRRKPHVGDLELLAVPLFEERRALDLFGGTDRVSRLDELLVLLADDGKLVPHPDGPKAGDRYRKLLAVKAGLQVDLFLVLDPLYQWGPLQTIRTGPADYSRRLVTRLGDFGLRCAGGAVERVATGERLTCPEETQFFDYCGVAWTPPERRA